MLSIPAVVVWVPFTSLMYSGISSNWVASFPGLPAPCVLRNASEREEKRGRLGIIITYCDVG